MPSKIQLDENLMFLYRCLLNSDYKAIDFNAVGAAANLKAPAARMRFSRLKKNIDAMLAETNTAATASTQAGKKRKSNIAATKKRKISFEDKASTLSSWDEEIDKVKHGGSYVPKEPTARPRTRGKKIDIQDAFDSDSATPGARMGNESSDDFKLEGLTDDEEEFDVDNDDEDGGLLPTRRKSRNQPPSRKLSTAKSNASEPTTPSKPDVHPTSRSVPDTNAKNLGLTSKTPVTPELKTAIKIQKQTSARLPPTPQSMPSLLDRLDESIVEAESRLGFSSHSGSRQSNSSSVSPKSDSTIVLPSIERDDEQAAVSALADTGSESSTNYSKRTSRAQSFVTAHARPASSESEHDSRSAIPAQSQVSPLPEAAADESCTLQ